MLATQCWPELLVLLGILVAYLLLNDIAVSHDVTWQMWIARQLLGGATLYRDILELNPPLWFWMALPVESMAQKFGIPSVQAMIAAVFLLATIALALLSALLAERTARERGLLLVAAFVATIIVPLPDFAQREHLALICALPYVALIARRADSLPTNWKIAAAAALIAGAGLALKHYFVLVPMVLEIWLLLKQRRNWTPLRAELIVLSSIGALYAVAVVVFAPDFLGTMVPMVNLAYAGYETTFVDQFARPYLALWALCAFALWKQRSEATSLTVAAALAALAFSLAYFAQQKGWRYHSIPATSLALFATATLWHRLRWKSTTLPAGVAMAAAVFVPIYASLVHGPHQNLVEKEVNDLLSDSKPGKTVVMLTANPSSIWPMVEDAGLKWPSRHFTFWMVHTIFAYQNEHGQLSSELERLAQDVRQQTVEDFTCNPPEMILVDDFRYSRSPGFDIVDFFSENAEFRQLFAHYDLVRQVDAYASYKKSDAWVPTASSHCRTIH
ncbi:hypothetical protein [Aminobacter sp. AP02]|uniref:hypothetical protein n=1 Tax=Aminobacter sp. AP02 TaxID=2135737 RepID=UPI001FE1A99D|nr:hypothetical protein [Aminobacter sp. AP02]